MTQEQVAALVELELANYRYVTTPGLLGQPWSAERVARELALLRAALVPPRRVLLQVESHSSEALRTSDAWVVAEDAGGTVVVYEPASEEFWLVEGEDSTGFRTFGVNGDLAGVFMAR